MNVTAKVNRDGSLTMHRKIDYEFDSDAHGVFYQQNLTKKQNLTGVKVKVDGQNVVPSNSGKNNAYQLTRYGKSYRFKVFHRIDEDDNVKVEYSYKILNAITNYKDTAELNFNLKTEKYRNRLFDAYVRDKVDESKLEILAAAEVFG